MTTSEDLLSVNKNSRKIKRRLEAVAENPGNRVCADCPEGDPRWASILLVESDAGSKPLAVLCCSQCRQLHQQLGDQVCRVKSIKAVDQWTEDEAEAVELSLGNVRVNKVYESKLSASVYNKQLVLEDPTQDAAARLDFIRQKYQLRSFFDQDLYLALLEDAKSVRDKLRASHRGKSPRTRLPSKSLSEDASTMDPRRKPRKRSKSFRGLSSTSGAATSSDESDAMSYSLPTHLGPGSARQRSSSKSRIGSKPNASARTRRGRRKTSTEKSNSEGLKSSSSMPGFSRWNTADASLQGKDQRWETEPASKNFRWGSSETDNDCRNNADSRFSDIAALRDSAGNNGFKPRAPQRVLSDDDSGDSTRHQRLSSLPLKLPSRVLSDEDDSSRRERAPTGAPLRMPRRVVSDESGGEDTDRSERTMPTIDPRSLLSRRRSLPSLNMNAKDDEDSIRNQYGGPNFVYSGHKERTADVDNKPTPKYGIKLKYGFDSATDTDSERKNRRTKPKELERPNTEKLASVPTLGCLLAEHPSAPSRILGERSAPATSDEESVLGGKDTGRQLRRKYRRTRSHTKLQTPRAEGDLYNYLKENKNQCPMKSVDLAELEKIESDISVNGFCFESGTESDVSVVCRPKTLERRRSYAGLGMAVASTLDDSAFTIFTHASMESNPAYD